MKSYLYTFLSFFLFLIIFSCNNGEKINSENKSNIQIEKYQNNLLNSIKSSSTIKEFDNNTKIDKTNVIKIGDTYYLKTEFDNGYISTTLLEIDNNSGAIIASVNCTSSKCGLTSGCIPALDKKSCTPCEEGIGDCVKTVTDRQQIAEGGGVNALENYVNSIKP